MSRIPESAYSLSMVELALYSFKTKEKKQEERGGGEGGGAGEEMSRTAKTHVLDCHFALTIGVNWTCHWWETAN